MEKNIFLEKMANMLDVEKVCMEDRLENFDRWDSLAVVGLLGMYAEESDREITLQELKNAETIKNLFELL